MKRQFQYSILQYHHSLLSEELLNIGIVLLFPHTNQARFVFPEKLSRLKAAFPNVPEKIVRQYLRAIKYKVEQLNNKPELFASLKIERFPEQYIESHLLIPDDSALQFGEVKKGVLYKDNIDEIAINYYKLYLSCYDSDDKIEGKHDEEYLASQYRKILKEQSDILFSQSLIQEGYSIKKEGAEYNFEFAWQNGFLNLVKPISFDLKKPERIQRKANQYFGQFTLLQEDAIEKNLQFDLLIARPSEASKALFKSYDYALKILQKPKHVRLYEEKDILQYTQLTIDELLKR